MSTPSKTSIAHLLLAAGASTRMGQPKQLLSWHGVPLIRHTIGQILDAGISSKVVVVLGAHMDRIRPVLSNLPVDIVHNPEWNTGMGSTIRCGLEYLLRDEAMTYNSICISLTDQPLITARDLLQLYNRWRQGNKLIAAAEYNDTLGVPAIFHHKLFPELLALDGQPGARRILQQHQQDVLPHPLPAARFDLDTPEDYQKLLADDVD